jgi:electron transfer flavoprotein alpha subunit
MENGDNFKLLRDCAQAIEGAAVGASRVAVDSDWVPYVMQVGQTGSKVNPKVYIACGISGSIQHLAGMKTSGLIIAVNTDPDAAIIAHSDYYVIGDVFEILPALARELKNYALV